MDLSLLEHISFTYCSNINFKEIYNCLKENQRIKEIILLKNKSKKEFDIYLYKIFEKIQTDFLNFQMNFPKILNDHFNLKIKKITFFHTFNDENTIKFFEMNTNLEELDFYGSEHSKNWIFKVLKKLKLQKVYLNEQCFDMNLLCDYLSQNESLNSLFFRYANNGFDNLSQTLKHNRNIKELIIYLYLGNSKQFPMLNDIIERFELHNFNSDNDEFSSFIKLLSEKKNLKELQLNPSNFDHKIFHKYLISNPSIQNLHLNLHMVSDNCSLTLQGIQQNQNLKNVIIRIGYYDKYDYSNDIYEMFLYNYSLLKFEMGPSNEKIDYYIKRNHCIKDIQKMKIIEYKKDIFFGFQ